MAADGSDVRKLLDRGIKDDDIDWGPAPVRIVPKRLTSKVKLARTGRKTRLTASGKLVLPAGTVGGCAGRVQVTVQRGAKRVARRTVAPGQALPLPGGAALQRAQRPRDGDAALHGHDRRRTAHRPQGPARLR